MWTCPKCKREFVNKNQAHSCARYPLENHFKGKKDLAKPLFEEFVKRIEKKIGKIKVESLACCIHLVSGSTFAAVWARKDRIKIDFRLDYKIANPRIRREVRMSANRYLYYLDLTDKSEIDAELLSWLKEAHNLCAN